jgi:hypothetical protein
MRRLILIKTAHPEDLIMIMPSAHLTQIDAALFRPFSTLAHFEFVHGQF